MEPIFPAPTCVLSGSFLGIKTVQIRHQWLQTISIMMDNFNQKKTNVYTRPIVTMIKHLLGFYPEPMYPEKGCQELVGNLAAMLDPNRVEIRLNTRVNSLEVDRRSKIVTLHTENSDIVASKAIVTSHASLAAVYENGAPPLNLSFTIDEYTLIHLLVRDPQPSTFSYVRFHDHEVLVRIRNVTKYARSDELSRDLKIISVHIRRGREPSNEDLDAVFGLLKTNNYVGREARVVDYKIDNCVDTFLTETTMKAIGKRYTPIIEPLRTDDNLAYAISQNMKRWRKAMASRSSAFPAVRF
jgi:hypothetical protein